MNKKLYTILGIAAFVITILLIMEFAFRDHEILSMPVMITNAAGTLEPMEINRGEEFGGMSLRAVWASYDTSESDPEEQILIPQSAQFRGNMATTAMGQFVNLGTPWDYIFVINDGYWEHLPAFDTEHARHELNAFHVVHPRRAMGMRWHTFDIEPGNTGRVIDFEPFTICGTRAIVRIDELYINTDADVRGSVDIIILNLWRSHNEDAMQYMLREGLLVIPGFEFELDE